MGMCQTSKKTKNKKTKTKNKKTRSLPTYMDDLEKNLERPGV